MKIILAIITAVFSSLAYNVCSADTRLHITTGFTSPVSDFYNSVLAEADKRLSDISISFEVLPAERSLALADQGINDADCCRIPAVVTKEYNNLMPVDTSFYSARFSAFSKDRNTPITRFEDLRPYSVGTVAGWKIAVNKVKAINPAEIHIVTTPEQLFHMLDQDRLDYGVVGYLSGLESLSKLGITTVYAIKPPLVEKQLYLMLNKKHKDLIPVFNNVIAEMEKDGTIDRLYSDLIMSLQ